MKTIIVRFVIAAWVLAAGLVAPRPALAGEPVRAGVGVETHVYPIRFLPPEEARFLIERQFPPGSLYSGGNFESVRQRPGSPGHRDSPAAYFEVAAAAPIHEKIEAVLRDKDAPPTTHTFQVLLLKGARQDTAPVELPASAGKALEEVKSFLPFKSFSLLDSAWIQSSAEGEAAMDGFPGAGYLASLRFRSGADDRKLVVDSFDLFRVQKSQDTRVLSTNFSISIGETIVLGTSRLDNTGQAIVVLFSAVR